MIRLVLLASLLLGCKTEYPHARVGMRLATALAAHRFSAHERHVDQPFRLAPQGVNGTSLMFAFLQRMEASGAIYASDLSYALQVRRGNTPIECISKIVLRAADETPPPAAAGSDSDAGEYSTTVKPFRPDTTDTWVTDRELACKQHATQVVSSGTKYDTTYDVAVGGHLEFNPKEAKTDIVYYDECTFEPQRKFVHRYEHFVAARFNPPDLARVGQRYSDVELVEEPPVCHEITVKPGEPLRQHMSATFYWGAQTTIQQVENSITPPELDQPAAAPNYTGK
jgi:hypothetical protein